MIGEIMSAGGSAGIRGRRTAERLRRVAMRPRQPERSRRRRWRPRVEEMTGQHRSGLAQPTRHSVVLQEAGEVIRALARRSFRTASGDAHFRGRCSPRRRSSKNWDSKSDQITSIVRYHPRNRRPDEPARAQCGGDRERRALANRSDSPSSPTKCASWPSAPASRQPKSRARPARSRAASSAARQHGGRRHAGQAKRVDLASQSRPVDRRHPRRHAMRAVAVVNDISCVDPRTERGF